ncbi:MAG: hypothetical protein ACOC8H_00465, partial [bacterium]
HEHWEIDRESLEMLKPPVDSLTNIEELFGQLLLTMSGMPEVVEWFMDEDALLAEFVRRWPRRERDLARTLEEALERVRGFREQSRQVLEELEELVDDPGQQEQTREPPADDGDFEPAATFILTEILRQRESEPDLEDTVRELGRQMGNLLRANDELRESLEDNDRRGTLDRIYFASFDNGIALSEDVWLEIGSVRDVHMLHVLLLLVMCPEREKSFCRCRQRLLESPDLWRLLADESR